MTVVSMNLSTETFVAPAVPPVCRGPVIRCLPLPPFAAGDLAAVRAAFAGTPVCALGQAWRAEPEPGFAPAHVHVGWRDDALQVLAELTDLDIYSEATGLNQRMWELGDAFELFLRPAGQAGYVEFHVTPNNQRLQLRFPGTGALRRAQAANRFDEFLLAGEQFYSRTWVLPAQAQWFVHLAIPAPVVGGPAQPGPGGHWHFSFARYDGTRGGGEPVISSTSPHPVADLHRQQEWGELHFPASLWL